MLAAYLNWLREEKDTRPNGDHWVLWLVKRSKEITAEIAAAPVRRGARNSGGEGGYD